MKFTLFGAVLLLPLAALAQAAAPPGVGRPQGDDSNDGSRVYPRNEAFSRGDRYRPGPDPEQQAWQLAPGSRPLGPKRENTQGSTPLASRAPQTLPLLIAQAGTAAVPSPVAPTAPVAPPPPPAAASAASAAAPASAAARRATAPAAATSPAAVPAPTRPRDAAFFEEQEYRLRTLKRLRDIGLISEDEYVQKRREVLGQL